MGNCVSAKGPKKDPKRLTEEEIKLLLDNTRLSRPQIVALHANFLKECPTGKLTKKDFIKLFKEVHPSENKKEKADKFCEYVFKVIDQQNLGYISFQEFVLCFSLTSDGEFKDKCEFAFKLYDLDKDGKISKKEMTQVLEALYDLSGITDRKGDKSPAKKVDDIIKAIHAKSALSSTAAIEAAPAAAAIEAKSGDVQLKLTAPEVSVAATTSSAAAEPSSNVVLSTPTATIDAGDLGKISAPTLTVSTTKEADKKAKEEKKAKKEKEAPKAKETKEEKAARKEREKQEKERLKQEKEREKKEKAERAKLEKEQKEREKKEKAELKKLDKTVKADKSASPAPAAAKPEKPAKAAKPAKEPKPAKAAKPAKASKPAKAEKVEFITKDQFIEACSTDEVLRQLFVDSIFCAHPDATIAATLGEKAAELASSALPAISADLSTTAPSIKTSKVIHLSTTTTTTTTNNNNNETTTTTTTEETTKTSEEPAKSESNDESKPAPAAASIDEIIDDIKNQIQINVNTTNEKVEINAS